MIIKRKEVIESDVLEICEKLKKYDENLRVTFNERKQEFEVYNIETKPTLVTWAKHLDQRLIDKVMKSDNRTDYNFSDKVTEINEEKLLTELKQRTEEHDKMKTLAKETRSMIKDTTNFI